MKILDLKELGGSVSNWMERLREGNWVWLVKEKVRAQIEYEWETPEPGTIAGRVCLKKDGRLEKWWVKGDGSGLDGSQLILPLEGELPEKALPLEDLDIRKIWRELDLMKKDIKRIDYDCDTFAMALALIKNLFMVQKVVPTPDKSKN